jgi:tetratricopeptide (TPR) repeat protein
MKAGFINKRTTEGVDVNLLIEELIEKNKINQAKKLCKTQLEKDQTNTKVLFLLSKIAIKESDIDTAMQLLFSAINIDPRDQNIQLELAKVLYISRSVYPESAQAALNILNQINEPESSEGAKTLLSKIFTDSNYFDEALVQIKDVLALNPQNEKAYIQWAKILIKSGENNEAFNKLKLALDLNPHSAEAFYLLSQIATFKTGETEYSKKIQETLQLKKLNRNEKAFLNLALAKILKDQGEYEKSFSYYQEAANQINKNLNYELEKDIKLFQNLKNTFTHDVFSYLKGSSTAQASNEDLIRPVFLISFPGINTDWKIESLLENKQLAFLGENSFLSQMIAGSRYNQDFTQFIEQFTKLKTEEMNIFRSHYLENVAKIIGSKSPIDTSKMNFLYIGVIKLLFPNAQIIYLKTPKEEALLDTYTKFYEESEMNFSYNLKNLNGFYKGFEDLMEHWLNLFPEDIIIQEQNSPTATTVEQKKLLEIFSQTLIEFEKF